MSFCDQNVVDSRGAADWVKLPLNRREYTTLNHIQLLFVFRHNINVKENFFFFWERYQDRDTKKEQALRITDWFIAQNERFWLAITKSYNENSESPEAARKVESLFTKIQLQLFSYCKYSSKIIIIRRQEHTHWQLQWCSHGRSHLERSKHWSLKKKMALRDTSGRTAWCGLLSIQHLMSQSDCEIDINCGKNW